MAVSHFGNFNLNVSLAIFDFFLDSSNIFFSMVYPSPPIDLTRLVKGDVLELCHLIYVCKHFNVFDTVSSIQNPYSVLPGS